MNLCTPEMPKRVEAAQSVARRFYYIIYMAMSFLYYGNNCVLGKHFSVLGEQLCTEKTLSVLRGQLCAEKTLFCTTGAIVC